MNGDVQLDGMQKLNRLAFCRSAQLEAGKSSASVTSVNIFISAPCSHA